MAKILRKAAQIFGSTASTAQIAKFGSLAASAPVTYSGATADPDNIQSLANWLQGWFAGVEGASSPAIEDLNAYCYTMAYQVAYQMQTGVPEWNSATTYYIGSVVNDGLGNLFVSLVDANLNVSTNNTTNWLQMTSAGSLPTISSSSGAYSSALTSPTDVTNLSVSFKVAGGFRGIKAELISQNSTLVQTLVRSATQLGYVQLLRSGFLVPGIYQLDSNAGLQLPSIQFYDNPTAGTYTYKIQAWSPAAGTIQISNMSLLVYAI